MDKDPWKYLGGNTFGISDQNENLVSFVSSGYKLLQWIGIFGCAITMIIAIIRFTSSNAGVRADSKNLFTRKVVLLFFIFSAAYFFGYVWGIFRNL